MGVGPLSLPVDVRSLPKLGHRERHSASEDERRRLAALNDLAAVPRFDLDVLVEKWRSDGVKITGRAEADVVQSCVVTLEPVENALEFEIDATFVPEGSKLSGVSLSELVLDPDGDDPPEAFDGVSIDVGALASELFSLSLDAYPRAEGATLPDSARDDTATNPFAALGALKDKKG